MECVTCDRLPSTAVRCVKVLTVCTSHVTRHTSHVTRHTSHVTRHTSHVTRHTSPRGRLVRRPPLAAMQGAKIERHSRHVSRDTLLLSRKHSNAFAREGPEKVASTPNKAEPSILPRNLCVFPAQMPCTMLFTRVLRHVTCDM